MATKAYRGKYWCSHGFILPNEFGNEANGTPSCTVRIVLPTLVQSTALIFFVSDPRLCQVICQY